MKKAMFEMKLMYRRRLAKLEVGDVRMSGKCVACIGGAAVTGQDQDGVEICSP